MGYVCFRQRFSICWCYSAVIYLTAALAVTTIAPLRCVLADTELEEVIVTARRREESLQESPIAISAFSGSDLQESGITNLADFNHVVPNVDVGEGNGNAGVANIFIRGVGQRNTEPNLDSGVATYLDGVYIGRADGALLDVNDLQSVQVLRGPQGTLFGKNSTGGALVFTTHRPQPEFEGALTLRTGIYDTRDAEAYINIPIIDNTLFTRLSVVAKKRDGYLYNVVDDKYYNDIDRLSAIWQLRWQANHAVTIDINANYGKTAQTARLQKCVLVDQAVDTAWQTLTTDPRVKNAYNKSILDFCRESQHLETYEAASDLGGYYDAENQGLSTTINWAISDALSFKSISAWRSTKAAQDDDVDSLAIALLHRSNSAHPFAEQRSTNQYSQEFQLSGDSFDQHLEWVAGLYAFRETTRGGIITNQVGPIHFLPPRADRYFYTTYATELDVDNKAYSVFTQFDWTLTDRWMLTAGLRYTNETRRLDKYLYAADLNTLGLNDATVVEYIEGAILTLSQPNALNTLHDYILDEHNPPIGDKISRDAWTPMASVRYLFPDGDIINNGSAYLTVSRGFRSGGLSEAPGNTLSIFEPEEVDNIELGVKIDTWNNRLRLNASLFSTQYTNRQLTTIVFDRFNGIPAPATINAEDSTISGLEIETMILPFNGFEIAFNASWNHGDIKVFDDVQVLADNPLDERQDNCSYEVVVVQPIKVCNVDRSDENLPRLPKRTMMLSLQYLWHTPYGTIIPRLQGSWKFDVENCFDKSSCESGLWFSEKQMDISGRLTWLSPERQWRITAFGSNLTNETYVNGGIALVDALGFGGQTYSTPRIVGIEAQYHF